MESNQQSPNHTSDQQNRTDCIAPSPIFLITSIIIIDRIGRHEVLLPINHNYDKICDILIVALINKKHFEWGVYWKEGAKSHHYGKLKNDSLQKRERRREGKMKAHGG